MLILAVIVKMLAEIALFALLAQGVVGLLSGQARDRNPVYRLLQLTSRPWVLAARWFSPKTVLDRHLPLVAFFVLMLLWSAAALAKVSICLRIGVAQCQ